MTLLLNQVLAQLRIIYHRSHLVVLLVFNEKKIAELFEFGKDHLV